MSKDKKHKKDKKRKRDKEEDDSAKRDKLAKKIKDHLRKHGQTDKHGYNDEDNRFNDSMLSERFVWGKKIEEQLRRGVDVSELTAKAERLRQADRLEEIEKVKKRREEREAELARQEEELGLLQRERAAAEAVELEAKEEEFHLEQARMRAAQRIREGRPKPVDVLTAQLHGGGGGGELAPREPYAVFDNLSLAQCQELCDDIRGMQALDSKDPSHAAWWAALGVVGGAELAAAAAQDEADRARLRGEAPPPAAPTGQAGLHAALDDDVHAMLAGKSRGELEALEADIRGRLDAGDGGDPEFWGAVLGRLAPTKARAALREQAAQLRAQHAAAEDAALDVPGAMGWRNDELAVEERDGGAATAMDLEEPAALAAALAAAPEDVDVTSEGGESEEDWEPPEEENVGQWSPPRLDPRSIAAGQDVVPEEEDRRLLELLRAQVRYAAACSFPAAALAAAGRRRGDVAGDAAYQAMLRDPGSAPGAGHPMLRFIADAAPQEGDAAVRPGRGDAAEAEAADNAEAAGFRARAQRAMGDMAAAGDAPFGGEVQLESKVYWWHDKYRPRRPKYFNRVHTGYEWNKYNQTHYDHDNPPPKVVQGYKFNLFYPDLIHKDVAPTFECDKDPAADEHGSTCLLRFHAGPPYEDLAFRIINKEWEYSHKKGFKCSFERGILHLYFNFKRQRYRR